MGLERTASLFLITTVLNSACGEDGEVSDDAASTQTETETSAAGSSGDPTTSTTTPTPSTGSTSIGGSTGVPPGDTGETGETGGDTTSGGSRNIEWSCSCTVDACAGGFNQGMMAFFYPAACVPTVEQALAAAEDECEMGDPVCEVAPGTCVCECMESLFPDPAVCS